ncbi:MAG: cell division protein FtsL [Armatimonadota bacterium]|nr:cell division protein FtsL [Armatimonadota bacterium]MDR7436815.1 cell division protein FtsL [Armatimonadota bacterium]MDR7472762.1 cell division protein FtsL [Armatimonadota bacterium]MDR7507304.1 cell division protein FtsL [Armatimonadota bacterium]MDR7508808.1 cell division protein FtsL [Armatimonadota bacterium]
MLALIPHSRLYPVLLPPRPAGEAVGPARRRRRSLGAVVAAVALVIVPAVALVAQRTHAARTGYAILALRGEVEALQAEHARLLADVAALRAPDRIERIAIVQLGMVPPRPHQVASLPVVPPARSVARSPAPSPLQRIAAWLIRPEAAAAEPAR